MYGKLYENKVNYIYKIDKNLISEFNNVNVDYLVFNPYVHYWLALDELSVEILEKICELNSIEKVQEYFCEKYGITPEVFQQDCNGLIDSFVKRKLLIEDAPASKIESWENSEYLFDDNIENYPFNDIYISISDKCNLDCIYCFNKEQRLCRLKNKDIKYMTPEKIKQALDEFRSLGGSSVVFTGGEPTLNPNFVELCEYAQNIGLSVDFITNGLLLDTFDFDRLFNCLDKFGISFDSIVDSELNKLWNISKENIGQLVLNNLIKVDEWAQKNEKTITISIMPIVSALNINSLNELTLAIKQNIKYCNIEWNMTMYDKIDNLEVDNLMSITEKEYIESVFKGLSVISPNDTNGILAYAYNHANRRAPSHEPQVFSCAPSFFLTYDGSIYPCQGCEKPEYMLGSIWEISLKEAFYKNPFKTVRKRVSKNYMEKCKQCELRFACATDDRPCIAENNENCKQECINRMFVDALVN